MKRGRQETVKAEVERQAGACRRLAMRLDAKADAFESSRRQRGEARVLRGWALTLVGIADALTEAMAEADVSRATGLVRFARLTVAPIVLTASLTGATEGFGETLYHDVFGEDPGIAELAAQVRDCADRFEASSVDRGREVAREEKARTPAELNDESRSRMRREVLNEIDDIADRLRSKGMTDDEISYAAGTDVGDLHDNGVDEHIEDLRVFRSNLRAFERNQFG